MAVGQKLMKNGWFVKASPMVSNVLLAEKATAATGASNVKLFYDILQSGIYVWSYGLARRQTINSELPGYSGEDGFERDFQKCRNR